MLKCISVTTVWKLELCVCVRVRACVCRCVLGCSLIQASRYSTRKSSAMIIISCTQEVGRPHRCPSTFWMRMQKNENTVTSYALSLGVLLPQVLLVSFVRNVGGSLGTWWDIRLVWIAVWQKTPGWPLSLPAFFSRSWSRWRTWTSTHMSSWTKSTKGTRTLTSVSWLWGGCSEQTPPMSRYCVFSACPGFLLVLHIT